MNMISKSATAGILLLALSLTGCGKSDLPDIGRVSGTVTQDGKPVADAVLTFQPEGARPSYARTDEDGYYEVEYTKGVLGATIGNHRVSISKLQSSGEQGGYGAGASKETLPAKYNLRTTLSYDVKPGKNKADFNLDSEGEVIQVRN
ncbi:hypothetical protein AB1L42_16095 [Thalassoglobus sp. JC818]|uniref:hypothetical protein n=1 Tax=Thalassoglobus sp. JC818 TaxID=3232136 RepID=UPI0034586EF7